MVDSVQVDVKSSWLSKINWTQMVGPAVSVAAFFGLNLSADDMAKVIIGVQAVQSIATVIIKTFFSTTITPSSATKV
jgi:hypothetical protein